jgi:hypothetical protein
MNSAPIQNNSRKLDLSTIRIASPCPARWDQMTGDERVRHCSECNLSVYNLSAMTEREIDRLLAAHQGQRLCTRLYRRADGTVITQDCPWSFRALKRRVARVAGAVLSALLSAGAAFARNSTSQNSPPAAESRQTQSGIVVQVVDPQGAVIPSAQIILRRSKKDRLRRSKKDRLRRSEKDRDLVQAQGTTDSDGRLEIQNVPAGDYVVMVTAKYLLPRKQAVTLSPQKVMSINIMMKADPKGGITIEMGPAGEPLMHNDAQVTHTATQERLQTSPPIGIRTSAPGIMRQ